MSTQIKTSTAILIQSRKYVFGLERSHSERIIVERETNGNVTFVGNTVDPLKISSTIKYDKMSSGLIQSKYKKVEFYSKI